jgi:hypothetical protein
MQAQDLGNALGLDTDDEILIFAQAGTQSRLRDQGLWNMRHSISVLAVSPSIMSVAESIVHSGFGSIAEQMK